MKNKSIKYVIADMMIKSLSEWFNIYSAFSHEEKTLRLQKAFFEENQSS